MSYLFTALRFTVLILLYGGILYPLIMTSLGQTFFPAQANGSLIKQADGRIVGSSLIGEAFTQSKYFHSRPSVNQYDASNSGGSNDAATNKKLIDRIRQDAVTFQKENPNSESMSADALTSSASGLDPHISLANALSQIPGIAQTRHINPSTVKHLVQRMAEQPLLAESPYVNVLLLNLALDREI